VIKSFSGVLGMSLVAFLSASPATAQDQAAVAVAATPAATGQNVAVAGGRSLHVMVAQSELKSDINPSNAAVYTGGGLLGGLIGAAMDSARAKKAEDLVKIRKYDYGVELGLGFNFFFQQFILSPEIKLSNGLPNLHSRDPNLIYSSVFDKIQSRMIVLSIHIEG